jgi:hypothetical protein
MGCFWNPDGRNPQEASALTGKCPASPALGAGSRGTIKMKFLFREAPACLSRPDGMAGELHNFRRETFFTHDPHY